MSGEDGGNRQLSLSAQNQAQASQPLMEMSHNARGVLTLCCILQQCRTRALRPNILGVYLLKDVLNYFYCLTEALRPLQVATLSGSQTARRR